MRKDQGSVGRRSPIWFLKRSYRGLLTLPWSFFAIEKKSTPSKKGEFCTAFDLNFSSTGWGI